MRKLFILSVLSLLTMSLFAQDRDEGVRIQLGLPFAKYGKFDHNFKSGNQTNYPTFILQADKAWRDGFRLGAYVGYAGQKNEFLFNDFSEITYNYYRLGGIVSYDLNDLLEAINLSPEFGVELYASLKTGFSLEHIKVDKGINDKENNFLFDLGLLVGGRYNISEDIDIYTELGYGNVGFVTIGFALNM